MFNDELEVHTDYTGLQKESETVTEYKDEANIMLGLLKARLSFLRNNDEFQSTIPSGGSQVSTPMSSPALPVRIPRHTGMKVP